MTNTISVPRDLLIDVRDSTNEAGNLSYRQHHIDHHRRLTRKLDELLEAPAQATDGLRIGAWHDALKKIAKYAPPVNCAARTEVERIGLIAVHALIAFSAPQFSQPPAHQEANNAAAPSAPAAPGASHD